MKSEEAVRQMLTIIKFFGHKKAVEALEWVLADETHNPETAAALDSEKEREAARIQPKGNADGS